MVHRARGQTLAEITGMFTSDRHFNDHYVKSFVALNYNINKAVHDVGMNSKQICRALMNAL